MSIQLLVSFPQYKNDPLKEENMSNNIIAELTKYNGLKILKSYNINLLLLYQHPINFWSTEQISFIYDFLVKLSNNQKEQMEQNDVSNEFKIEDINNTLRYFELIIKNNGIIKVL